MYGIRTGKRRRRRSIGLGFKYKRNARKKAHRIANKKHHAFNPRVFKKKKRY